VIGGELPDVGRGDTARDVMRHRGPDDYGVWRCPDAWLASRRLAIIDLTSAGHQPLRDSETGVTLAFNGAIHNYVELQAELASKGHVFRGRSDTEVLLRAYLQWGEECVTRFNGMWAFVIWDPRYGRAFFSRDRFGIKPLFMTRRRGGVGLASEPKVLISLFPELRAAADTALYRLLAEKRIFSAGESFYEQIEAIPAAHCGTYTPGEANVRLKRFWEVPGETDSGESPEQALERFSATFDDAVRIRLRADVPTAATLSGGLDSTAVLHAARQALPSDVSLRAYTSVYGDGMIDELPWAERAVSPYDGVELRRVPATVTSWVEMLRRIVWHLDGPVFSPAVFPLWRIMETAHGDGVKVLLEGQGADELLGGYPQHMACALLDTLGPLVGGTPQRHAAGTVSAVTRLARTFPARRLAIEMGMESVPALRRWERRRSTVIDALRPEFVASARGMGPPVPTRPDETHLRRRLLADFARDLLPAFLHYGDAISMAHSIETRLPFLDHRVVELCFQLDDRHKISDGETKAVLRAYLRSVRQQAVAGRGRKMGYPTPSNEWMAGGDGGTLKEVLLDRDARTGRYVDPVRLERLIDRHAAGAFSAGDVLFGLLCTELWLQECVGPGPGRLDQVAAQAGPGLSLSELQ
jgi:asparagine synthase (glutamine-hydrolysing)